MRGFGFVPDWGQSNNAPDRTNQRAYFPSSPAGTLREATFSETLAGVLGADPAHTADEDLEDAFKQLSYLDGQEKTTEELWSAFEASYVTTGERGLRGSGAKARPHVIPFHRTVAMALEVDQARNWWRWYWMLMTDGENGTITRELHERFVTRLYEMPFSNIIEQLAVEAIETLDGVELNEAPDAVLDRGLHQPIPPLVPECGEAFREDLIAWLNLWEEESMSRWMRGLRDILCFHYMMYFLQVAITLEEEYEAVIDGPPYEYEFEIRPIYFGLESETASGSRRFTNEWNEGGVMRALYDSWGRLAVMSHVVDVGLDGASDVDHLEAKPYTLSEALAEWPGELQQRVVERLLDEFPAEQRPDGDWDLAEAAPRFAHTVRRYYENMGKTPSSQTAYTLGYNALYQLGRGTERRYIERRSRVGTILRLDRAGLRLFARLFDATRERGHIDEFWTYMRQRGIQFDHRSEEALIEQLGGMGLLQKQSDSGEAMYVETI
jgi:DNA phosphorothioation-dependent restriction protein DptG